MDQMTGDERDVLWYIQVVQINLGHIMTDTIGVNITWNKNGNEYSCPLPSEGKMLLIHLCNGEEIVP